MTEEKEYYKLISKTKPETPRKAVKIKYPDGKEQWHTLNDKVKQYIDLTVLVDISRSRLTCIENIYAVIF